MSYEKAKELATEKKVPLDIGFVPYPHPDRGTNWIRALLNHHEKKIPFPKRTTDPFLHRRRISRAEAG